MLYYIPSYLMSMDQFPQLSAWVCSWAPCPDIYLCTPEDWFLLGYGMDRGSYNGEHAWVPALSIHMTFYGSLLLLPLQLLSMKWIFLSINIPICVINLYAPGCLVTYDTRNCTKWLVSFLNYLQDIKHVGLPLCMNLYLWV